MGTQPGHAKLRITGDAVGRRGIIGVDGPIGCANGIVGLVGVGGIGIVGLDGVVGTRRDPTFRGAVPRVVVPDVVVWGVVPVVLPRRARPEVRVMDARPT